MRRTTEFDYIYRLLKEVRTREMTTNRLMTYTGIGYTVGLPVLQKLERLGFMHSFKEGRSMVWRTTMAGADLLNEIINMYQRLELL